MRAYQAARRREVIGLGARTRKTNAVEMTGDGRAVVEVHAEARTRRAAIGTDHH